VEGPVGGEHLRPPGDGARELDRVLVGLGAAGREERPAAFARPGRQVDECFREFGARVVEPIGRTEAEPVDLGVHRRAHRRMAVAEVRRDEARRQVHVAFAVGVVQIHAFATHDRRHVESALGDPGR
jgi:DNA-directed RNA polymerase subunit N (RpoN/RPB10)